MMCLNKLLLGFLTSLKRSIRIQKAKPMILKIK
jgi:hypothetical protein